MKRLSQRRGLHRVLALGALLLSTTVFAGHPRPQDMRRVQQMAHQVEQSATALHRIAERRAHHGGYAERMALQTLHSLEDAAAHFHRTVEINQNSPRHTERDFRELVRANRTAQTYRYVLHGDRQVERLFRVVDMQMRSLTQLYNQSTGGSFNYRLVMQLSHTIDERADHAHRALERELNRWGHTTYEEQQAMRAVHEVAEAAEHLHENVERRNTSMQHTVSDFRKLKYDFENAQRLVNRIHVSYHVISDFLALRNPINQLARIYGERTVDDHHDRDWRRDRRRDHDYRDYNF